MCQVNVLPKVARRVLASTTVFALLSGVGAGVADAQKPAIDTSTYKRWAEVSGGQISADGKYVMYTVQSGPEGGFTDGGKWEAYKSQPAGGPTLVLIATDTSWKRELPAGQAEFSPDSRMAMVTVNGSTVLLVHLGDSTVDSLSQVASSRFVTNGQTTWLVYQFKSAPQTLVLRDLSNNVSRAYANVASYVGNDSGTVILLTGVTKNDSARVQWMNTQTGETTTIWNGRPVSGARFDRSGSAIAFVVSDTANHANPRSFWYYKGGMDKPVMLADAETPGLDSTERLSDVQNFSQDGNRIFVTLKPRETVKPKPDSSAPNVVVWTYRDPKLQSQQLNELTNPPYSTPEAVIDISSHRVVPIARGDEMLDIWRSGGAESPDTLTFISRFDGDGDPGESNWSVAAQQSTFLVSTVTGERRPFTSRGARRVFVTISPDGRYAIYFDRTAEQYVSYDLAADSERVLTQGIKTNWNNTAEHDERMRGPRGIAGWVPSEHAVLLYDQFDLWECDLAGAKPPINLTNGYGAAHNITFFLAIGTDLKKAFAPGDTLLLSAFNNKTKDNGFFHAVVDRSADPEQLTMGPYLYESIWDPYVPQGVNFEPVKAKHADVYLVRRMSATEAPNFFSTTDFRTFIPLSNVQPQKDWNWVTSELVTWKGLDGRQLQGVLYKPQDFDSTKKYPVIFYYYERLSDQLNAFLKPELSDGALDVATYVSNGYLVFLPDIYYQMGATGQSAVNSVVSAAQYLATKPFVDAQHMGIQGISFGGFETYYLVTHTQLFAAASSSSGGTDFVSYYDDLLGGGSSQEQQFEEPGGQYRIGPTLWQRPDLYLNNSSIINADHVTTPLLMMATPKDGAVPYRQAIEMFTALRRLGRRVWMLEYDEGDHGVWGKSSEDFTIRMRQFFDHYLKSAPAPKWMVEGIPAKLKGIDSGYELEPQGVDPGPGLVKGSAP